MMKVNKNNLPNFIKKVNIVDKDDLKVEGLVIEFYDGGSDLINEGDFIIDDGKERKIIKKEIYLQNGIERVKIDTEFGWQMILEYLADSKKIDVSTQESLIQLQKFQGIKALLESGALGAAIELLTVTEVDSIFTQERKDKYLQMLNEFLS